jgi:hypothetical protein
MWFQVKKTKVAIGTRIRSHVGNTGGAKAKQAVMALDVL